MKKKLVKNIYKNKKEKSINLLMATCLGKQFEVGKGHGQVGPGPGRGGGGVVGVESISLRRPAR